MTTLRVISDVLVVAGVLFMTVSLVGLLRLPDFYARAHGVAKSETLGLVLVFTGLLLQPENDAPTAIRLGLILVFSLLANPTSVHALIRAAFRSGALPQVLTDQQAADAALRRHSDAGGDER